MNFLYDNYFYNDKTNQYLNISETDYEEINKLEHILN